MALRICESESTTAQMLLEHAVLLAEVCELGGLMAIEPSSDADDHEVEESVFHGEDPTPEARAFWSHSAA